MYVAVLAVSLADDGFLELLGEVVQGVAHRLHLLGFVIPRLHLLRVFLHLFGEVIIDGIVFLG